MSQINETKNDIYEVQKVFAKIEHKTEQVQKKIDNWVNKQNMKNKADLKLAEKVAKKNVEIQKIVKRTEEFNEEFREDIVNKM